MTPSSTTPRIAIIGASGKLGRATLSALVQYDLHPTSHIVALTSSQPGSETWKSLENTTNTISRAGSDRDEPIHVRHASFDDPGSLESALGDVDVLFLVSTPRIAMDFDDAPHGRGREKHHFAAIDASVRAAVKWLVYSSLAFAFSPERGGGGGAGDSSSKAGVMRAHLRTEAYLRELVAAGRLPRTTVIREGLYNESWPLYLGYFDLEGDGRASVKLAGDGKICWTSIRDLGIASAQVLTSGGERDDGEFVNKTFYLSTGPDTALSMADVARVVSDAGGKEVLVEIVFREEYVRSCIEDLGRDKAAVEWWSSTYEALEDRECLVEDATLESILARLGIKPIPMEDTIRSMVKR